jgi:hypothetical protein
VYRRAVQMLEASARYCWRARSRFSSANNHLVGELSGLVTVGLIFPEVALSEHVLRSAIRTLATEADHLVLDDGAGAEQSISYQMFAAELLAGVVVQLRLAGRPVPDELTAALDRGADYLISLVGTCDPDPRYGDDDDSFAVRLGAEEKRTVREHLAIVAAVTGHPTAARYGCVTLTAAWIADALGADLGAVGAAVGTEASVPSIHARSGGLAVLRGAGRRLTMDVGPLGYLSTAAHGHADALSVTVAADGQDLVVDPGTGSFYGDPAVRDAHRGTRAHPTVCVDGVDQSMIGGAFFWRRHARTTTHLVDLEQGLVVAEHDGYRRLDDPVMHRRWLIAPPDDPTIVVVDVLDGRDAHDIAVSWPLHPSLDVTPTLHGFEVTRENNQVMEIACAATNHSEPTAVRGDRFTHLGWWSDRLEARTPAWTVGTRCASRGPLAVVSLLCLGESVLTAGPEITRTGTTLDITWQERGLHRRVQINMGRPEVPPRASNIPTTGLVGGS